MLNEDNLFTGTIHVHGEKNGEKIDKVVDIDFPVLCKEWEQLTGYDEQDPEVIWSMISSTTKLDYEHASEFTMAESNLFARKYNSFETQNEKDEFAETVNEYLYNSHSLNSALFEMAVRKVKK